MKRPMAWVGLSFFSALILFCIYGLWACLLYTSDVADEL